MIRAWNMVQLPGLTVPLVAELLGIEDLDRLVEQLLVIQESQHG